GSSPSNGARNGDSIHCGAHDPPGVPAPLATGVESTEFRVHEGFRIARHPHRRARARFHPEKYRFLGEIPAHLSVENPQRIAEAIGKTESHDVENLAHIGRCRAWLIARGGEDTRCAPGNEV